MLKLPASPRAAAKVVAEAKAEAEAEVAVMLIAVVMLTAVATPEATPMPAVKEAAIAMLAPSLMQTPVLTWMQLRLIPAIS